MTTTPKYSSQERTPGAAVPIEQLYVMHCLKEDSVLGQEGFSVRAASSGASESAIFEWALKLDYYELPLDMKSGALLVNQAPRRLARVPGPAGRVALVHTAYLPQDTVGRSHSFISQILLLPELSNLSAAAAWGSSDWQTTEYTRGETKLLPALDRLPRGTLIDDAALTGFLSGSPAPADQSLARTSYPSRVASNPDARRRRVREARSRVSSAAAFRAFARHVSASSPSPAQWRFWSTRSADSYRRKSPAPSHFRLTSHTIRRCATTKRPP